ncbi:choline/carnitine O-acyltransferase [Corynebacterium sp.]|uniref:choline/carnitine O-acyltransferase n=1 Tax=Corynebacterium sp. TaxID=1720 RepID=UPI0026DA7FB1|nr:choline/carnitine O-acyltransferase [Corynebacterium sp.]MDO4610265.1 choline/carnitine O-acyltransferase [Corynebacterium sp.]
MTISAIPDAPSGAGKPLPVPALADTADRVVRAVSAVADGETTAATRAAFDAFIAAGGEGPTLQERLLDFAAERAANGSSWLAGRWLSDYLTVRGPLPLTTNVGFRFRLDTRGTGVDRLAEALHRIASLHLLQAGALMPPEIDSRGNLADPGQWECLAGGIRVPCEGEDQVIRDVSGSADREIGVARHGRLWAVRVSDAAGHPLPVDALRGALETVLARADGAGEVEMGPAGGAVDAGPAPDGPAADASVPFLAPSYLGSGELSPHLARMLADPGNAAVHDRLAGMLCMVTLTDQGGEDEAELLRRCSFEPGHAWTYKPVTYEFAVDGDWSCLHVEHSTVDGATLVTAIRRLQGTTVMSSAATAPEPEELRWTLEPGHAAELRAAIAEYGERAARLRVRIVDVPRVPEGELAVKVSADALSQLILSVAQQLAYGRVRAVYEAVDMREYRAGRTECLRAVTPEAVALARALADARDDASRAAAAPLLRAALDAHRGWVKACKSGAGFDRHLWALRFTAEEAVERGLLGAMPAVFTDPGIAAARSDFLSTTSIGSDAQIVRYAFAPTVEGGFGVNYTPHADHVEYCVIHDEAADGADRFLDALPEAALRVADAARALEG